MTRVLARPSRPLPVPPGPGLAFRQRLAAQADAALAAGAENPLRVLLEAAPGGNGRDASHESAVWMAIDSTFLLPPAAANPTEGGLP